VVQSKSPSDELAFSFASAVECSPANLKWIDLETRRPNQSVFHSLILIHTFFASYMPSDHPLDLMLAPIQETQSYEH
jgi:hypothetical protein